MNVEYKIICNSIDYVEQFNNRVTEHLNNGWAIYGDLFVVDDMYNIQMLYVPDAVEDSTDLFKKVVN